MNENLNRGDFVRDVDSGRVGVVENVSSDREVVDVLMNDGELVSDSAEQFENVS